MSPWPIGVFASIDAGLGVPLSVAAELGVTTIHLHAPHAAQRTAPRADEFLARLDEYGLRVTAVFGGFEGESYADIPTVSRTVGLAPAATRAERLQEMREIADFSRRLGVGVVALHLGFVPHDRASALYRDIVAATRELCDHCQSLSQCLHLETGQEPADALLLFLADVRRDNLRVNFDPANMILYGVGEPIAALEQLGRHVGSVHCKDALWSDRPGETWGVETPLGEGAVGMERFLATLKSIGYIGPLTIEREIPHEPARQKAEIGRAVTLLSGLRSKLLARP
jgi:sugar phosphate isomerase/epimerase